MARLHATTDPAARASSEPVPGSGDSADWAALRPSRSRGLWNLVFEGLVWTSAAAIVAVFLWLVGEIVFHGWSALDTSFLTSAPERSGRAGGISTIIVSTLSILAICLAVSVPLGLGTAVFLAEYSSGGRLGVLVRGALDVLAGVPSIVFGLFGNAFFCVYLGLGFSILSGGLTLACMVLPILIRSIELGLRSVSNDYRIAAAALDMSRYRLLVAVLLPAAAPSLAAGLLLGIGRAMAETAALLFTSGYVDRMPESIHDSGRALSVHIYDLAMNVPGGEANAYASALVLVGLLLVINALALAFVHRFAGRRVQHA